MVCFSLMKKRFWNYKSFVLSSNFNFNQILDGNLSIKIKEVLHCFNISYLLGPVPKINLTNFQQKHAQNFYDIQANNGSMCQLKSCLSPGNRCQYHFFINNHNHNDRLVIIDQRKLKYSKVFSQKTKK